MLNDIITSLFTTVRVRDNIELLKQRMQLIIKSRDELNRAVDEQAELSREYLGRINSLKPELKRLSKRRDQLKK